MVISLFCLIIVNSCSQNTIAVMGYGPEDKNAVLELTYTYGVKSYDKGNGYAQVTPFKHILFDMLLKRSNISKLI